MYLRNKLTPLNWRASAFVSRCWRPHSAAPTSTSASSGVNSFNLWQPFNKPSQFLKDILGGKNDLAYWYGRYDIGLNWLQTLRWWCLGQRAQHLRQAAVVYSSDWLAGLPQVVPDLLRSFGVSGSGSHQLPCNDGATSLPLHPFVDLWRVDCLRWELKLLHRYRGHTITEKFQWELSFQFHNTHATCLRFL